MQLAWMRLPFRYRDRADFGVKLDEYISRVFYECLPQAGYQIREEQVYTAYRMAGAFAARRVLLAEAATGTGKTFAYLVGAVCHARLTGAPVVIACATDVLHRQLAGPDGDVATLSQLLALDVDARIAADPRHYLCELKVQALGCGGLRHKGLTRLLRWAGASAQGNRSEVPDAPDELWDMVAWDPGLACDTCGRRGNCRLARARAHYRQAPDLLVCSHALFFQDLWTRQPRKEAGRLPILPPYSAVVLDEGHRALEVAQVTAGNRIGAYELHRALIKADEVADRRRLMEAVQAAERAAAPLWAALGAVAEPGQTERRPVAVTPGIRALAAALASALEGVQVELVLEEDRLRETSDYFRVHALQAQLDDAVVGLTLLQGTSIAWLTIGDDGDPTLWVVPRHIGDLLRQELFDRDLPVVLTSATLAGDAQFGHLKRSLGVPQAEHSQVGAPFDLARRVLVYIPAGDEPPARRLVPLLQATDGRALVLVNDATALAEVRSALAPTRLPFPLLWEGDADRAELLRRFRAHKRSVLIGTAFWEGIDVPGESLSCTVIYRLPWPPDEPLVRARRADALAAGLDPFSAVDVPEMVVKLKQGLGRLIRTTTDRGVLALLDTGFTAQPYATAVLGAFPAEAERTADLQCVAAFLKRTASRQTGRRSH